MSEEAQALEYTALASSPLVTGEVKLVIGEKVLLISALFDTIELPFFDMDALRLEDYSVIIETDADVYSFTRMGAWCKPFYDALLTTYNKAVLRALFATDKPLVTASGDYCHNEDGVMVQGSAPSQVQGSSVLVLPPNLNARRIPLCFTVDLTKGDYELTLKLDTGEVYTLSRLGYDTVPFATAVEARIRVLREASLAAVKEIDPTLRSAQAAEIAKMMPQGAAVSLGRLAKIAPDFVVALESKLARTRAAESYTVFREICDPVRIHLGFRKNESGGLSGDRADTRADDLAGDPARDPGDDLAGDSAGNSGGDPTCDPASNPTSNPNCDPYLLWLIAPSPDGRFAAVEFAEENSATFIYRTDEDFEAFANQLNRALEAIDFKREVIRLSDEELRKPENADYYMASRRTAALRFIRSRFVTRIIHSNPTAWRQSLIKQFEEGGGRNHRNFAL